MTANWSDPDRLLMFDTSIRGAEAALDRLSDGTDEDRNLPCLVEAIWWLDSAIMSMKLAGDRRSIFTAMRWVRNRATHDMWNLFRLTEAVAWDRARFDHHRYDDWVFASIEEGGGSYDSGRPEQEAYVHQLEGNSVRMYLASCLLELKRLRPS